MPAETHTLTAAQAAEIHNPSAKPLEPTHYHRYVTRDVGNLRPARIHQQKWEVSGGTAYEWRDVPVVDADQEQDPQISTPTDALKAMAREFPETIRRDPVKMPGDETITLSEAAAKAWHGRPTDRGDWPEIKDPTNSHERVARADASLAKQLQRSMERNGELAGLLQASIRANEGMLDKIRRLEAQLPEGMKECTIVVEECPKGHGSLRGTNWIKQPCVHCRIQKQQRALKRIAETYAHPETIKDIAKEGMEP